MRIAVLGLGLLGAEVALRLKRQGHEVIGWNRGEGRAALARQRGLSLAATPAEAIAASELALLLLSDAAAIQETLFGQTAPPELAARTLVQMGTIGPDESRALAARVSAKGGAYLEAPVLGSLPEAREGRLILMAGGDPKLFERLRPVFLDLSPDPQHIGEIGQAAALKLAMNQLIAGLTATFALSLGLVRGAGIEVEQFMRLLRASALYAKTFDKKLANYLAHDYSSANFPLKHLRKDIALFRQTAAALGLETSLSEAIEAACLKAESLGLGDADYSALYEALVGRLNEHGEIHRSSAV
ncbi:MAG: NAD(P)-dependent oxidoreductase [Rhodocyclaceae bacterium]|nr:NAD(P)-dependent oxidoreductase [Rhodocyclaceae bacterium]